ncbi:hypothetical protein R0135_10545 [Congregibacter variabilis]|uniref:Uncharacterized protein n=1 Tax=Congregibacter variabilis TaxID=3081200 RepID=A0ABZ0HZE4_9GAMM|nr:hypothetical protein R0135_10545 [Congregibacter sp. IMCC43200]
MNELNEALLYTLSQVTIALVGFSAIAISFATQTKKNWGVFEKANAWCVFGFAVVAFLASIIPPVMIMAGLSADASLIVGFAVIAIGVLPMTFGGVVLTRRLIAERDEKARITRYLSGRMILHGAPYWAILCTSAVWFAAFDFLIPRSEPVYVSTILVGIILCLIHFSFFLALGLEATDENTKEKIQAPHH